MSLPSKNCSLAMFATIAVSTMMLSAVAQADPNPYLQGDLRVAEASPSAAPSTKIKKSTMTKPQVNGKKKIQSVPGGMQQTGKEAFVKEGPIFVKDGGKLPGVNQKIQTMPAGAKSLPSAVDVEKQIRSTTDK